MDIDLLKRIEKHRQLCIKKDLFDLSNWIDTLTYINTEISLLKTICQQQLKEYSVQGHFNAVRRKNTLLLAKLCKYEQQLHTDYEYGKKEYDVQRFREHEAKRNSYYSFLKEFRTFKKAIYKALGQ